MSIYVACPCGQAFQARADLAGSTLACPACGRPLLIPPVAAPLPWQPLKTSVPAKSGIPTSILIAAVATAAVAVVLIGVVVFQQFKKESDHSSGGVQTARQRTDSGSIATQTTSTNTPTTAATSGWKTVPFNEGRYSVSMPSADVEETVNDLYGQRHRETRPRDPQLKEVLVAGAYKGNHMQAVAFARVEQLRQEAQQSDPPGLVATFSAGHPEVRHLVIRQKGDYTRHAVVVTSPNECVVCTATTAGNKLSRAEVDRFIESLRLGTEDAGPAVLAAAASVLPGEAMAPIAFPRTITFRSLRGSFLFPEGGDMTYGAPGTSPRENYIYRAPRDRSRAMVSVYVQENHSSDVENFQATLKSYEEAGSRDELTSWRGGNYGPYRMAEFGSQTGDGSMMRRTVFVGNKSIILTAILSSGLPAETVNEFFNSLKIDEPPSSVAASDRQLADSEHPNAHLAEAFQTKIVRKTRGGWLLLKSHTDRCTFEMPEDAMQAVNVNVPGRSAEVFRYPLNLVDEEGKLAVNVTVTTANVREPIDRKFAQMEEAAKRNKDLKVETTSFGGYTMKQWTMEAPRYRMERVIFLDTNSFIIMTAETGTKVDRAMIERFLKSIKL